jgi:predicted flap endonuclease-1-like 5' DNA nuclease
MNGLDLQLGIFILGAIILSGVVGWLIRGRQSNQTINQMDESWQSRFDKAVRQNEHLNAEVVSLRTSIEAEKAIVHKHTLASARIRTEIESMREKEISLKKSVFQLSAEKDEFKAKVSTSQNAVNIANQRVVQVQTEFNKNQEFYKAQLDTSSEERGVLERKIKDAKSEQESLNNLLLSARAEYDSVSNMLSSAQSRLETLETLEQKVISLEADNVQLKHAATLAAREAESLRREVGDLAALKEQNRELAHCLKSMESSRKQHEDDALRYRDQYEQSEQESETLRFKIGDIEKNWQEMQQDRANAKKSANGKKKPSAFGLSKPEGEVDDLTEIIGIGKVFERTLHDLGVYHFRQIAAFGPVEIARINTELKEFKGRVEHDDWIGQAKDLHFKKYGEK